MKSTYIVTRAEQSSVTGLFAVTMVSYDGRFEVQSASLFDSPDEAFAAGDRACAFIAANGRFPNMSAAF